MYAYMYVCVYICMCVYMCVYVCLYVNLCAYMYVFIYISYIYIYILWFLWLYAWLIFLSAHHQNLPHNSYNRASFPISISSLLFRLTLLPINIQYFKIELSLAFSIPSSNAIFASLKRI